jgi:hypothetical protein
MEKRFTTDLISINMAFLAVGKITNACGGIATAKWILNKKRGGTKDKKTCLQAGCKL